MMAKALSGLLYGIAALTAALLPTGASARLAVPDVQLFDQSGAHVRYGELVRGRTAVIAFLFTGCSSSCPVIGQRIAQVRNQLASRAGRDIVFIGVSVNPMGDTPAAMAKFSRDAGLGAGWHFLNGRPDVMARLRETLGGGGGGAGHANFLLISNDRTGVVSRIDATTNPTATIVRRVAALANGEQARAEGTARYFATDGRLVTADERQVDFYRDVVAGRVVLIDTIFTRCVDACPLITQKLARTRKLLGALAAQVRFVSLSNDPAYDTPARLRKFASERGVSGDWMLLTGAEADMTRLLARFNLAGSGGGDHSTALIIGNDRSGSWRRVSPAVTPEQLAQILRQVLAEKAA